eukprot:gene17507-19257_t
MIIGIVYHASYSQELDYISKTYSNIILYLIFVGLAMIIAGSVGLYCIFRKSYPVLIVYLAFVALLVALHIILGVLAFSSKAVVDEGTDRAFKKGYNSYFSDSRSKSFMDWSQQKFECCGETGPTDYQIGTHSTASPANATTTAASTTARAASTTTTVTNATTISANTTTTAASATTTTAANTTTTAASTTTTAANTTTVAANTTTTTASTTTTAADTTTTAASATTTAASTTPAAVSTTTSPVNVSVGTLPPVTTNTPEPVFAGNGDSSFLNKRGLPQTCCKKTSADMPCKLRPNDIFKQGCYKKIVCFIKSLLNAIGISAFCFMALEIIGFIAAALDARRVKKEDSYIQL